MLDWPAHAALWVSEGHWAAGRKAGPDILFSSTTITQSCGKTCKQEGQVQGNVRPTGVSLFKEQEETWGSGGKDAEVRMMGTSHICPELAPHHFWAYLAWSEVQIEVRPCFLHLFRNRLDCTSCRNGPVNFFTQLKELNNSFNLFLANLKKA